MPVACGCAALRWGRGRKHARTRSLTRKHISSDVFFTIGQRGRGHADGASLRASMTFLRAHAGRGRAACLSSSPRAYRGTPCGVSRKWGGWEIETAGGGGSWNLHSHRERERDALTTCHDVHKSTCGGTRARHPQQLIDGCGFCRSTAKNKRPRTRSRDREKPGCGEGGKDEAKERGVVACRNKARDSIRAHHSLFDLSSGGWSTACNSGVKGWRSHDDGVPVRAHHTERQSPFFVAETSRSDGGWGGWFFG